MMRRPTFSIALLASLSYLLALALWCSCWWLSYATVSEIELSEGGSLVLVLIGLALMAFAKRMTEAAGQTAAQFLVIIPCAIIGFGSLVLGLTHPISIFPTAFANGQGFALFLIGLFAIAATGHASRLLAGETEDA
jgi:hypothetical protein